MNSKIFLVLLSYLSITLAATITCKQVKSEICSSCSSDNFQCTTDGSGKIISLLINNQDFSKGIPSKIFSITTLKDLYLNDDKIKTISSKITNLNNLRRLDLRGNQLTTLPKEIGNLSNLKYLKLSNNNITSLHSTIEKNKALISLYLSNCKLKSIPSSIGKLSNLESLLLKRNKLRTIPEEIGNLKNLKELVLDNNCIFELPSNLIEKDYVSYKNNDSIDCLTCENLKESLCSSCSDSDFECKIDKNDKIYHLLINNQDFSDGIPDIIFSITSLKQLYLLNDKIPSVPAEIGNLINLKRIDIRGNEFKTLPDELENLSSLQYLKISNNPLTTVPCVIQNIKSLIYLYMSNCKLETISSEIENLSNLQKLLLGSNELRTIPDLVGNLNNLNELVLSDNCIDNIPETVDTDKVSVTSDNYNVEKCEYTWIQWKKGDPIPSNAVYSEDKKYVVGHTEINGGIHSGYVDVESGILYLSYAGPKQYVSNIEILTIPAGHYYWKEINQEPLYIDGEKEEIVLGGKEALGSYFYGEDLAVIRIKNENVEYFGKMNLENYGAVGFYDEYIVGKYEVLIYTKESMDKVHYC
ncbi:RNI-like protein [Anaeromyces robustus]|uniref:RNI-like protein n=1 Tax=Anaeromyces robustus TaxID=1754192 RepID=A0A1Y1XDJ4_9FUNG|nr:RNI-like protein [Anaeromyces robustus]|eukprot:ORX83851.1 RNI-like protein [Anaeromyces robustus]